MTSRRTLIFETSAVIATAVAKFIFMDHLNWRFLFIVSAISLWAMYVIYRNKRSPGILRHWGFRRDNFFIVGRRILPFGIAALIIFVGIGLFRNTINASWHIIPLLLLYPLWGTIQQFLLIALTAGNLQELYPKSSKTVIILMSAILFALIHYPYTWLMIGTFLLAVFYGFIYLRERNLYALGIFHGWLAAFFFYTVVDRDPFIETFGKILGID